MTLPKALIYTFILDNIEGLTETDRIDKYKKDLSDFTAFLNIRCKDLYDMFRASIW